MSTQADLQAMSGTTGARPDDWSSVSGSDRLGVTVGDTFFTSSQTPRTGGTCFGYDTGGTAAASTDSFRRDFTAGEQTSIATGNALYTFSTYTAKDTTADGDTAQVGVEFFDSGDNSLGSATYSAAINPQTEFGTLNWGLLEVSATVPTGATYALLYLVADPELSGSTPNIFWDDLTDTLTVVSTTDTRVSQAALLVGSQGVSNVRISQAALLVGIRADAAPCLTQEAYLWQISLREGSPLTTYRFTSHDRDVVFRGDTYTPCDGLETSAFTINAELGSTDGFDVTGIINAAGISEIDLWAGLFDGAAVEVWRYSWGDRTYAKMIAAGNLGKLDFTDNSFTYEVITAADRLKQRPLLQTVTPSCRFDLYGARCGVTESSFTDTGIVTQIPASPNLSTQVSRRQFTDTGKTEASQYWQFGRLTWISGNNAGQSHDVRAFDGGVFTLETPTRYAIEVGDDYRVTAGCDRTEATCIAKFSNGVNFGGFPHLRGEDDLNKQAPVK